MRFLIICSHAGRGHPNWTRLLLARRGSPTAAKRRMDVSIAILRLAPYDPMMQRAEALVIGGGVAGAAVATRLARAGRAVVLVERKAGAHDKVCGEFVSSEAALYLGDLNIDLERLGAVRISKVRLYSGNKAVVAQLPFPALSLSRRVLDEALVRAASKSGAAVLRGRSVRSLQSIDGQWIARLEDGHTLSGANAFLATGKHDLKGWKRPQGVQGDLVAFKMHYRLRPAQIAALGSNVELYLYPGGYAGLELVEDGIANLCLVIRMRHLAMLNHSWESLISVLRSDFLPLQQRLAGSDPCWNRPLAISSIPYGYVKRLADGPWHLGDQAAVIPSFSGDGISIALHSARLAAEYYLAGKSTSQFQGRLARDIAEQVRRATLISRVLVHPGGQAIAIALARIFPDLLRVVARYTRIPSRRINVGHAVRLPELS
jgi:menaquinone-9 beta-reductase